MSNQIQQNKMQPEHVSEVKRSGSIFSSVCVLRSVAHGRKRYTNDSLTLTGKPNPAQITRSHYMFPVTLGIFIFSCL